VEELTTVPSTTTTTAPLDGPLSRQKEFIPAEIESSSSLGEISWPVIQIVINISLILLIIVLLIAYLTMPMPPPEIIRPARDITSIELIPPEEFVFQTPHIIIDMEIPSDIQNPLPEELLDISMDMIPLAESTMIKAPSELQATFSWVWDSSAISTQV
jgi:hypothetical protein